MRRLSSRRVALPLVALACALPRLAVLLHVHASILGEHAEKSWDFARTFVATGTFGFIPGQPSASTQPLYGVFLVPLDWLFGSSGLAVGVVQIGVAVGTALLVYEIGRRILSPAAGLAAALAATLQPYLIWHDVHANREILDQLLGAGMVLLALVAADRRSLRLGAALGLVSGLAVLSNARLALLPVVLAAYLLARIGLTARGAATAALVVAGAAVAVAPWIVRNELVVGCATLTTDARALWKANNANTYATLADGKWIDDVPPIPGMPPTPEQAYGIYRVHHRVVRVDECAQMRFYRRRVLSFWRDHPGEKARLAGQAAAMLWSPQLGTDAQSTGTGLARTVAEPAYVAALYLLALLGLPLVPRATAALLLLLLAYETAAAAVFAGTTRYRVPWDFALALLAAAAVARASARASRVR